MNTEFRAGDIIAFSGTGFISSLIKWKTKSDITHVAIVYDSKTMAESTTLKKGDPGVSKCDILDRLVDYKGRVYHFPLARENSFRVNKLQSFLDKHVGAEYDTWQAIFSACLWYTREDFSKMFCSEYACGALEYAGQTKNHNCSEMTPIGLLKLPIYKCYYQIKGKARTLKSINKIKDTYSTKLLQRASPHLMFNEFSKEKPMPKTGSTVTFRRGELDEEI